jgi:PAS domain-containing protein
MQRLRSHGSIKDYETCLRTASEQRIWGLVSARKSSLRGENVLLLGINDITERKRAEEALRDSESRYRAILQTTAEGYVLIDLAENAIVDVNPALCRMLGTRRQELVGARLDQYIALESREEWQKLTDSVLRRTLYM